MIPKSSLSGHEVYPRNKEVYSGTLLAHPCGSRLIMHSKKSRQFFRCPFQKYLSNEEQNPIVLLKFCSHEPMCFFHPAVETESFKKSVQIGLRQQLSMFNFLTVTMVALI
jgi:hypothetical protein